jgi:hypothetical protein
MAGVMPANHVVERIDKGTDKGSRLSNKHRYPQAIE